ncbi:MAG TPA: glycine zipper 2TM domain-containing protein [Ramlibacter sp.]|nr:glycine zipper 2TM domain-containing protein [Ramlibacter sp.]
MSTIKTLTASVLAAVALVSLSACSDMSRRERDTAIGAGVGAVAGSALTGGSALGTLGGAAAGGIIGNEAGKPKY